jgi:hypothetical protein
MLTIAIPDKEYFDESKQEFVTIHGSSLQLEHSLVSLSKWESKWRKPFFGKDHKTAEETLDYIRCMTVSQNAAPEMYDNLPGYIFDEISEYINSPMTATWFRDNPNAPKSREVVTAEIIYYWMIVYNIPIECHKWHLNRLLTLIRVCNDKNQPSKKTNRREMLADRRALNEARRAQFKTGG